jgi:PKHD-type hydroxylase
MSYLVFRLLQREELEAVLSYISWQTFSDGGVTAQGLAREVKHNLQIERTGPELSDADRILIAALERNRDFQDFAFPKRLMLPMFSRYDPGMEYCSHVDDGVFTSRNGEPVRSDIAVTIFLSPPSS